VYDGGFNGPLANSWATWGSSASVTNGVLTIARQAGTASGGFYQWNPTALPANGVYELSLRVGNSSPATKTVNFMLRSPDWTDQFQCWVTLSPGAPMQQYTMRFRTTVPWTNTVIQAWLQNADGAMGMQFDDLDLRYRPDLAAPSPNPSPCSVVPPANTNLVFDGGMTTPVGANFATWNSTANTNGGVLTIARNAGTSDGGFFQWNPYRAGPGNTFEYTFQLGNSSGVAKTINMMVRDPGWADTKSCWITLPANTPLQTYVMRFRTTVDWSNLVIQAWLQNPDGAMGYRVDNLDLRYVPGLNVIGNLECPQSPAAGMALELETATATAAPSETPTETPSETPMERPTLTETPVPTVEPPTDVPPLPTVAPTDVPLPTAEPPTPVPTDVPLPTEAPPPVEVTEAAA
jgi:hypothetical protein